MTGLGGLMRLPSFVLLLGLGTLIVMWPWVENSRAGFVALATTHLFVLLLAVRAVVVTPSNQYVAAGLAIPVVVFQAFWLFGGSPTAGLWTLVALALFYGFVIVAMLRYVLGDDRVTADELFAAASMYVLTAMLWGCLYMITEHLIPGSFAINEANNADGKTTFLELLYFSFTTLTSVGFGEITPANSHARSLVMLEQIVGVLYVALLIARLTGMYPVTTSGEPPTRGSGE